MEIIQGLINTPKSQSAEDIIPTLCDRLSHASLASDKRAAILTLKGFSREYRESVIANGLRGIINTLKSFTVDTEIIKASLETLLILFIRGEDDDDKTRSWISQQSRVQNGKYPSPLLMKEESNTIDQFSLWIADEVTQDDSNVGLILSLLENTDFYVRIYTLQFLEALVSMRPVRAKEAILNAPLGISSLITVLEDSHDPVRNEAVLLLMAIANDNFNIQKLIAFENTFDRLFEIIHEEGDIRGSIVVQDCLSLIANLLKYNVSNQKLFLETNCLPKLAYLIGEPLSGEEIIWNDQRLQNVIIALDIVKLFVLEGNESTKQNQEILSNADIFIHVLRLSFSESAPNPLRATALLTTADLIQGNPTLQYQFSSIDVPYIDPSLPKQLQKHEGDVSVVIALLNWCLFINSVHLFDIRVAASHLLQAYFKDNKDAKSEFIEDQISTYKSNDEVVEIGFQEEEKPKEETLELPEERLNGNGISPHNGTTQEILPKPKLKPAPIGNLFKALLEYDPEIKLNPYKIWFSSVTLLHLFEDDEEIKQKVQEITTGDEEAGEEVLTAIQAISEVLVTTLSSQDPRISISYLMLLVVWLYEDFLAVNDFLSESSTIKALLSYLAQPSAESGVSQGLVAVLLGVAYEFSSKDSPMKRVDLHSLIVKMIGKDSYSLKIRQFKENPLFAEFTDEVIFNPKRDETGLPEVFFDPILISLIKENYNRIKNTLNKDPKLESNGRISYEKFEELQETYLELKKEHDTLVTDSAKTKSDLSTSLESTKEELTKSIESYEATEKNLSSLKEKHFSATEELKKLKDELVELEKAHQGLSETSSKQNRDLQSSSDQLTSKEAEIKRLSEQLEQVTKDKQKADNDISKMSRELFLLSKQKDELEKKVKALEKTTQNSVKQEQKLKSDLDQKSKEIKTLKDNLNAVTTQLQTVSGEKVNVERQLTESKTQNGQSSSLVNQLSEKLRGLANSFNELTVTKESLEAKVSQLQKSSQEEVATIRAEVEKLSGLNADLESSNSELKETLTQFKSSSEGIKKELDENIAKLTSQHKEAMLEAEKLAGEVESLKNENSRLKSKLESTESQFKEAQSAIKETEETHSRELSNKLDGFTKEKYALEKKVSDLLSDHSSKADNFTNSIKELQNAKKELQDALSDEKSNLSKIKDILSIKEKELDSANSTVATLTDQTETQKKTIADHISQIEKNKKQLSEEKEASSKRIEEITAARQELEVELDDLAVEFEGKELEFKKEIKSLKEKVGSLEEEKKSLESTLEIISQNIDGKAQEYEALKKDFKSKEAELLDSSEKLTSKTTEHSELEKRLSSSTTELEAAKKELKEVSDKLGSSIKSISAHEKTIASLGKKIEEKKAKHIEEVGKLENDIRTHKEDLETKVKEFEKERGMLTEGSDSATKEYIEKLSKLEEKLADSEKKSSIKIKVLESQKSKLEDSISELETKVEELTIQNSAKDEKVEELTKKLHEFEKNNSEAQSKIDSAEKELTEIPKLRNNITSLEKKLSDKAKQESEKESQVKQLLEEVEKNKEQVSSKIKEITKLEKDLSAHKDEKLKGLEEADKSKSKLQDQITVLQKAKKDELDVINAKYAQLEKAHRGAVKAKEDLDSEIKQLKDTLKGAEEQANSEKLKAEKEEKNKTEIISNSDIKIKSLEEENSQLQKDLLEKQNLTDALESEKVESEKLKKELEELKSKALESENIKKELEQLKSCTVPKTDLDDLMLVLDEMDEAKKKYKAKTKDLGGEVSSDEESDEDEDEDEDGEDDE